MVSKAAPQTSAVFNRKLMRKQKDIMFCMQCAILLWKNRSEEFRWNILTVTGLSCGIIKNSNYIMFYLLQYVTQYDEYIIKCFYTIVKNVCFNSHEILFQILMQNFWISHFRESLWNFTIWTEKSTCGTKLWYCKQNGDEKKLQKE